MGEPGLPVTTATGKGGLKHTNGFRRGYPTHYVLLLCIASFIAGRYLETLMDLDMLPIPGGPKEVIVRQEQAEPALARAADALEASEGEAALQLQPRREPAAKQPSPAQGAVAGLSLMPEGNATSYQQRDIDRITKSLLLADEPPLQPAETGNPYYNAIPFQVLSWFPRIVLFPKFLDDAKCDHIIDIGKKRLAKSTLALRAGETEKGTMDIRTSSGCFLSASSDSEGVLGEVDQRISDWTNIPKGHFEPFNLLRYELGQHYDSHYDAFDDSYGPQSSQRMATVLVYLSTPEEGGETVFPLEGRDGLERLRGINYKRCDMGLRYQPRKGDALLFWSLHPNGTMDKHSLHGGCPVMKGEKWVITKWIRDKCFGRSPCV